MGLRPTQACAHSIQNFSVRRRFARRGGPLVVRLVAETANSDEPGSEQECASPRPGPGPSLSSELLAGWQRPPAVCQARRAIGGHVPVVETSSAVRKFPAGVGGSGGRGPPVSDRGRGQAPMGLDRGPCSEVSPTAADLGVPPSERAGVRKPPAGVGAQHVQRVAACWRPPAVCQARRATGR